MLLGCAVAALAACGGEPSEVELRLYRCAGLDAPMSVRLEIQSFDEDGAALGGLLGKTFDVPDPAVFSDGYATVGFVPPGGTVTADIAVIWTEDGAQSTASFTKIAVPPLGQALVLGADACDGGETTTETTTAPTTSATGTTGSSSGGGETGSTGSTGSTGTTEVGTSSTSGATETETSSTGDGTGSTGTGTTGPIPGEDCPGKEGSTECSDGIGKVGQFVKCQGGVWQAIEPECVPEDVCGDVINPKLVGCFGVPEYWTCACIGAPADPCMVEGESSCDPNTGKLDVCLPDMDMMLKHHVGYCGACGTVDGHATCVMF